MGSHVNGERYKGSYKNGLKDGFGEWIHPDGDNYRGKFKAGIKRGKGVYTFENGGGSEYGIYNANFWEDRWAYEYYFQDVYGYNDSESNAGMTGHDYYPAGQQSTDFCYPEWNPWLAERLVVNIGNISIPQGYMITVNAIEYYHVWGNTTGSVVGNSTQQTHEGGSTSQLLHSEYYDHMIFTKESGGISVNSLSYYGGWDTLELDIHLHLARFWESSDVTLTILYSFTPVIPVE